MNEALKLDPNDIDVRSRRASVLLDLDEDANALADIDVVLKSRKHDTFAYEMRSTAMFVLGKPEQALTDITKSLQYATDAESKMDRLYRRAVAIMGCVPMPMKRWGEKILLLLIESVQALTHWTLTILREGVSLCDQRRMQSQKVSLANS